MISEDHLSVHYEEPEYAGFWARLGSILIDLIILFPLVWLTYWLGEKSRLFQLYYFLPNLAFTLWFSIYLVKQFGGTPGKLLCGIRIQRIDGLSLDYRTAFLRDSVLIILTTIMSAGLISATLSMTDAEYLSYSYQARNIRLLELVPAWYMPLNYIEMLWVWSELIVMLTNKRRRALHDFIAGTIVVKARRRIG